MLDSVVIQFGVLDAVTAKIKSELPPWNHVAYPSRGRIRVAIWHRPLVKRLPHAFKLVLDVSDAGCIRICCPETRDELIKRLSEFGF